MTESLNNSNPYLSSTIHGRLAQTYILAERQRQDQKWGEQNHDPIKWSAILTEECGELAKESLEMAHGEGWDRKKIQKFKTEAIQCAAVATAIVEWCERKAP